MTEIMLRFAPKITNIILDLCGIALFLGLFSYCSSKTIVKKIDEKSGLGFGNMYRNLLVGSYDIFLAIVSSFPLLGMLGTVLALIGLDITSTDTESLKKSFLLALDTTAYGLIASIFFKFFNSFVQNSIETAIEKSDILIKESYLKSKQK